MNGKGQIGIGLIFIIFLGVLVGVAFSIIGGNLFWLTVICVIVTVGVRLIDRTMKSLDIQTKKNQKQLCKNL